MADRTIEQVPENVPEFEGILEAVMLQALDEAREKLLAGEELVPFTALAVGDTLFIETHPGDDAEECFAAAQHTVQNVRGAAAYAFCYDGYVETNEGELDALIAEGGVPGSQVGHAIACLYTIEGEGEQVSVKVDDHPLYIGQAPNFMEFTLIVPEDEFAEELEDDQAEGAPGDDFEQHEVDGADDAGEDADDAEADEDADDAEADEDADGDGAEAGDGLADDADEDTDDADVDDIDGDDADDADAGEDEDETEDDD